MGLYQNLPSKIFCLTGPKKEPFTVSLFSGIEKFLCLGGLCHDFLSKFFCLALPKNFVWGHFCAVFHKTTGIEKVYG